ncbi:P-type conjugative transfer protein TrbG [uncultured Thiodictyon sp.]|uniref:P-type conjugative transfer protein TrbG n=1 Tax=uncultured Thiodictyon sp. TaxID=1846217 RepID=UPI0025E92CF4|nr:P-type conjugative transfer protein TrbG [uncultured Thiodictyon sp.]
MRMYAMLAGGCLLLLGAAALAAPADGTARDRPPGTLGTPIPAEALDTCPGVLRDGRCVLPAPRPEDVLFSGPDPILTQQEEAALALADEWQAGNPGSVNFEARNGVIIFKFGMQQPSIVCAVLQLCDIALQQGEQITAINLGDTGRWTVESALAGTEEKAIPHVIIKPTDVGLETSLVVATDRRIYHLRLRSHRTRYMPQVAFTYKDGIGLGKKPARVPPNRPRSASTASVPTTAPPQPQAQAQAQPLSETKYLSNIDFNYLVSGDAPWKPVNVYNDGRRTYIRMPAAAGMNTGTAPSLLVVDPTGASGPPVNYVVEGDSYVVDMLFDKALLVAGTQPNQTSITIARSR